MNEPRLEICGLTPKELKEVLSAGKFMNRITNLFRKDRTVTQLGAVILLDTDLLTGEDIERIKRRMTPVFIEFSGTRAGMNMQKAVTQL